jgi:hypothetical protein
MPGRAYGVGGASRTLDRCDDALVILGLNVVNVRHLLERLWQGLVMGAISPARSSQTKGFLLPRIT